MSLEKELIDSGVDSSATSIFLEFIEHKHQLESLDKKIEKIIENGRWFGTENYVAIHSPTSFCEDEAEPAEAFDSFELFDYPDSYRITFGKFKEAMRATARYYLTLHPSERAPVLKSLGRLEGYVDDLDRAHQRWKARKV
ncbi:hypothetical protein AADZ90_013720 [Aestuariibius sp. 2305UL40-4]|uniref:hypothetical protein n=1 Tax=Aestuariibius violaceus TaxID=3234132 RepID=UPI00345E3D99